MTGGELAIMSRTPAGFIELLDAKDVTEPNEVNDANECWVSGESLESARKFLLNVALFGGVRSS